MSSPTDSNQYCALRGMTIPSCTPNSPMTPSGPCQRTRPLSTIQNPSIPRWEWRLLSPPSRTTWTAPRTMSVWQSETIALSPVCASGFS